jgi:hypothetical protein
MLPRHAAWRQRGVATYLTELIPDLCGFDHRGHDPTNRSPAVLVKTAAALDDQLSQSHPLGLRGWSAGRYDSIVCVHSYRLLCRNGMVYDHFFQREGATGSIAVLSSVRHSSGQQEALPSQTTGPNKKLTETSKRRLSIRTRTESTPPLGRHSTTNS